MVFTDRDLFVPGYSSKQGGFWLFLSDIQGHPLATLFLVFIVHL